MSEKSSTSQTTGTIRFCTKGGNHRLLKQWKAQYGVSGLILALFLREPH
ncbi:hypothetical protein [Pseudomonas fluorescens]